MGGAPSTLDYIKQSYKSFCEGANELDFSSIADDITEVSNSAFSIFLEDFIVNDKYMRGASPELRNKIIGSLWLMHSMVSLDKMSIKKVNDVNFIIKCYIKSNDPIYFLTKCLLRNYVWDGTRMYEWKQDVWVVSDNVNLSTYIPQIVNNIDMKHCFDDAKQGVDDMLKYYNSLSEQCNTFLNSEEYSSTISSIKRNVVTFNACADKIPCRSGVLDVGERYKRLYKRSDFFTVKLDYDPVKISSTIVDKFVFRVSCSNDELATLIISCGTRLAKTLTIVSGVPKSGKTTLLRTLCNLYGPLAYFKDENNSNIDYSIVRTYFIDENNLPSESELESIPCGHIVISCDECYPNELYAGRNVRTLHLSEIINKPKTDISSRLAPRLHKSSLLGWAITNCIDSAFKRIELDKTMDINEKYKRIANLLGLDYDKIKISN